MKREMERERVRSTLFSCTPLFPFPSLDVLAIRRRKSKKWRDGRRKKSWPFLLSSSFGLAPPRETLHLLRPNFKGGEKGLKASVREAINPPKIRNQPSSSLHMGERGGKGRLWCVFPFDRSRKLCFRSPGRVVARRSEEGKLYGL